MGRSRPSVASTAEASCVTAATAILGTAAGGNTSPATEATNTSNEITAGRSWRIGLPVHIEISVTYSMKRRIPTVNVAVAITVPTIHRMSRVSRFAISVRTPAVPVFCSVRRSAI